MPADTDVTSPFLLYFLLCCRAATVPRLRDRRAFGEPAASSGVVAWASRGWPGQLGWPAAQLVTPHHIQLVGRASYLLLPKLLSSQ